MQLSGCVSCCGMLARCGSVYQGTWAKQAKLSTGTKVTALRKVRTAGNVAELEYTTEVGQKTQKSGQSRAGRILPAI